jgi:multiple sugar transport system substrate-binding protein
LVYIAPKTGIDVKMEVIGWPDLQTRIQTAVTSGQGPDVVNIGNTWAVSLQATGAFLPSPAPR